MSETLESDDVINRAHELETYVTQYQVALKALRTMQDEVDEIVSSLHQKKDELSRHEQDLVDYLKKLQLVSQKADAVLTPIVEQKQELEALTKKVEEGIAGLDGMIQERTDPRLKDLEAKFDELISTLRTESTAKVTEVLKNQERIFKNLAQRIDANVQGATTLKGALEEEKRVVDQGKKDAVEMRKTIQDLKVLVEKQGQALKHEFDRQTGEIKAALGKQKEELTTLTEQRRQEIDAALTELREKHVKVLEKDEAQLKSTLNALISKLGNVKFKKLLGL